MISRRNIRVKVMQTVYTLGGGGAAAAKPGEPQKLLRRNIDAAHGLLIYLTFFLTEVARYAETDAFKRSGKHLPSEQDLNVNTKIAGNAWLWKVKEDEGFARQVTALKPEHITDTEAVRRIYTQLVASPQYQSYIATQERDPAEERRIVEFILNDLMLADEDFVNGVEERFMNWEDDAEMVVQILRSYLQKPGVLDLGVFISAEKWEFARTLLQTVLEKDEHLQTFVVPRLKNWDAERIAALDMIIMKLGVAELLYFETIPPKVTINEYIDIAKEYSTAQSGQFVNGILDNIHKELVAQGSLHKTDFRKAGNR